jgi:hypothetical protein
MDISLIGNSALRVAIQRNLVSFPAHIPPLMTRPGDDTHERVARLYFAGGWPVRNICARFGFSKPMVQRLISDWRIRAVAAGYIQDIHPEDLDILTRIKDESEFSTVSRRTDFLEAQLLPPGDSAMVLPAAM